MKGFVKDPDALLDYTLDWTPWLGGDTIDSSVWILETGITSPGNSVSSEQDKTTVWIQGGEAGSTYKATNRVTTAGGRTDDRTIIINVRER